MLLKIKNKFDPEIAYFSIPTYSGGLGILAGDALRSAADMDLPMVGVTLTYKSGYFYQRIGPNGEQIEKEMEIATKGTYELALKLFGNIFTKNALSL